MGGEGSTFACENTFPRKLDYYVAYTHTNAHADVSLTHTHARTHTLFAHVHYTTVTRHCNGHSRWQPDTHTQNTHVQARKKGTSHDVWYE